MTDIVQVKVLEVGRAGVKVKVLDGNRIGFIRRREPSGHGPVDSELRMPAVNGRLAAMVLRDGQHV